MKKELAAPGAALRSAEGDEEPDMSSLYDELIEKLKQDPRLTKRGGARADLGLLLFNARDSIAALWEAADRRVRAEGAEAPEDLRSAVEALRPIFGTRD